MISNYAIWCTLIRLCQSNIVVTENCNARLMDFGLSRYSDATWHSSRTGGIVHWMAPELLDKDLASTPTFASDVYAFACLVVEVRVSPSFGL
jgi:serine/threonine protein kinase